MYLRTSISSFNWRHISPGRGLFVLFFLCLSLFATTGLGATFTVSNTSDSGPGSLRDAITQANGNGTADVINFSISGVIVPATALPVITEQLTIDGSGQTIQIDFDGGTSQYVLQVNTASGSIIQDLDLSFSGASPAGYGIGVFFSGGVTVQNCTISNRLKGIVVQGGDDVQILNNDLTNSANPASGQTNYSLQLTGVAFTSLPGGVLVTGNTFGNSVNGIGIQSMDDLVISNSSSPVSGTNVEINGMSSIATNALVLTNVNNYLIDGVDASAATSGNAGILVNNLSTTNTGTIRNCIINNRNTGIEVEGGSDVTIQNNDVSSSGNGVGFAITIAGVTGNLMTGGVDISGNTFGNSLRGIGFTSMSNLTISDGSVSGTNVSLSGFGTINFPFHLTAISNSTIDALDVSYTTGSVGEGMSLTNCSSLEIKNSVANGRLTGIRASNGSDYTIQNNNLDNSGFGSGQGISMSGVTGSVLTGGVLISGNTFVGSQRAIRMAAMSDLTISDGSVGGTNVTLTGLTGCTFPVELVTISNSTVDGLDVSAASAGSGFGLILTNCNTLTLQNNNASSRQLGMSISGGSDIQVLNNDFSSTTHRGINVYNLTSNVLTGGLLINGNTFTGANALAILSGMSDLTISDGSVSGTNVTLPNYDGGNGNILDLASLTNSSVESLDLSAATAGQGVGMNIANCTNLLIQNCSVADRNRGMNINGGTDYTIQNNDLTNASGSANLFALDLLNISATTLTGGVSISGNTFANGGGGVRINGLSDLTISDGSVSGTNVALSGLTGFINGLFLTNVSTSSVEELDFSSTSSGVGTGLKLDGCSDVNVQNCVVDDRSLGIDIVSSGSTLSISCTQITNNGTGVRTDNNSGQTTVVSLTDNEISGNGTGIENIGSATTVTASDNYWGSASGPAGGDVSGTVTTSPFLSSLPVCLGGSPTLATTLDFDGVDDRILIPNGTANLVGNTMTISGWVYPRNSSPSFPDYDGFFGWRNGTDADFYILQLTSNGIEARFRNSAGVNFDITANVLVLNTWQHVALTYDGSTLTLYHDGVAVGSVAANGDLLNPSVPIEIGKLSFSSTDFYLDGQVDDVRFWNFAQSGTDIMTYMNCEMDGTEPGLVAYYDFNQGIDAGNNASETTLLDRTSNGTNGTLQNFALNGATSNWVLGQSFSDCNYVPPSTGLQFVVGEEESGPNNTVIVPVSVNDFDGIATYQGTITFDDNILTFVQATSPLTGVQHTIGAPGIGNVPTDAITFSWYDPNLAMTTLTDGTVIMNLEFTVNASAPTGFTDIEIDGSATPLGYSTDLNATTLDDPTVDQGGVDIDADPPTVITQPFTVQLDVNGDGSITVDDIDNGSFDASGIDTRTLDITDFDCSDVANSPITVTLTVTDIYGNSASGTALVTVEDNIGPAVTTQPYTAQLDASGNASITVADIEVSSSDACGIDTKVLDITSFTCADVANSPITVTLTVTDVNGNATSETALVTVEDNVAPVVTTQPYTAQLDASGNATITVADIELSSSDACGIDTKVLDITSVSCSDIANSPITVTLTVTDVNGNATSETALVTVEDNVAPVVTTQPYTIQLDASGNATLAVSDVEVSSTDACGIDTKVLDITSFSCSDIANSPITVTLTVTDVNGNATSETALVTVEDNVAPVVTTQPYTAQLDASGNAIITVADIELSSSDACGIATKVLDITSVSCSDIVNSPITVTLTVTDVNGNATSETALVTVEDNVAPVISGCPSTIIQAHDPAACGAIISWTPPTATDNCVTVSTSSTHTPGDFFALGTTTVTYTFTDDNGNSSQCSFDVVVTAQAPTAASFLTVGYAVNTSGTTFQLTDDIAETAPPFDFGAVWFQSLLDLTYDFDLNFVANFGSIDAIGGDGMAFVLQPLSTNQGNAGGGIGYQGITPSLAVEFDDVYNSPVGDPNSDHISIQANGDVDHTTANALAAPVSVANFEDGLDHDIRIVWNAASTTLDVYWDGAATPTISYTGDVVTNIFGGDSRVYFGWTGSTGLYANNQFITFGALNFVDNPTIDPNAVITPATCATAPDGAIDMTVTGGIAPYTYSWSNGATSEDLTGVAPGSYTVTVTDVCGTTATETFIVGFEDNIAPVVTTQPFTIQLDASGNATLAVSDVEVSSTDACGIDTKVLDITSFSCSDIANSPITVTLTVTDVNGNATSETALVTVEDNVAPVVTTQPYTAQLDASGNATITVADIELSSSDACGIDTKVLDITSFSCSDIANSPITVTLTVTDVNGNATSETALVTVEDNVAPVVTTQPYTIQLDASGNATLAVSDVEVSATDACGIDTKVLDITSFSCSDIANSPITVTLTVTDVNGNATSETALVTVEDNVDPVVITQPYTAQLDASGNATITADDIDNGSSDNCAIDTRVLDITSFDCNDVANSPITVTLTVTDVNGNSASQTALVTVLDDPIINITGQATYPSVAAPVIPGVIWDLAGDDGPLTQTAPSIPNPGPYGFDFLLSPCGSTNDIGGDKQDDAATNNGVDISDAFAIVQHLLLINQFTDPYQIIAADVNATQSINILDAFQVLRKVVGARSYFTNPVTLVDDAIWTFIPSDHTFANPLVPYGFPTRRDYNSPTADAANQDFVGVKLGDVNQDWNPAALRTPAPADSFYFEMGQGLNSLTAGSRISIPVRVKDFNAITGYQLTMKWDAQALRLTGITDGALEGVYNDAMAADGYLSAAWVDFAGQSVSMKDGEVAFELEFEVIGEAGMEVRFEINSDATPVKAFDFTGERLGVGISSGTMTIGGTTSIDSWELKGYNLLQNVPNPFASSTNLIFSLGQTEEVDLAIYNVRGQLIQRFDGKYPVGEHQIEWNGRNEKGMEVAEGIYIVRIQAGGFSSAIRIQKMN